MSVARVDATICRCMPPVLEVNATGVVNSSGWSNGRLEPRYYVNFPQDGIQDFDFVADPPGEMVLWVMSPIPAKPLMWKDFPKELKGVRVHAQSNKIFGCFR
jgi:hypothetical protein